MAATSVHANPPPSCLNGLFFFILFHVVPYFAGFQVPIFLPLRQAGPGFTPSHQTDPISFWVQASFYILSKYKFFFDNVFQLPNRTPPPPLCRLAGPAG